MAETTGHEIFSPQVLKRLFPEERTDAFFEALFGDATEGAYNIQLSFTQQTEKSLRFQFQLTPRPGKCLACNLTYGLPALFSRHPIIDVDGLVDHLCQRLDNGAQCHHWHLGQTEELSPALHVIPLVIDLKGASV